MEVLLEGEQGKESLSAGQRRPWVELGREGSPRCRRHTVQANPGHEGQLRQQAHATWPTARGLGLLVKARVLQGRVPVGLPATLCVPGA